MNDIKLDLQDVVKANLDLVSMNDKLSKHRERYRQQVSKLENDKTTILELQRQLRSQMQQSSAQDGNKCCILFKKAMPVVTGILGTVSQLSQLGINTAGQITGNPTLTQTSEILSKSTDVLLQLGSNLEKAKTASDYIKGASKATKDALKIASTITGNNTLSQIGDTVQLTSHSLATIGDSKNPQDIINTLSNSAATALKHVSKITGDQKLDAIGTTIGKAGNIIYKK